MSMAAASAAGLTAAVVLLALSLVVVRASSSRRRSRLRPLRKRLERELATFLATGASRPTPRNRAERLMVRAVALDALDELRGRERERVTMLLEELGIVDDAVAALRSRRVLVRRRAAETLAQARVPSTARALLAGLGDRDRTVAFSCARGLAELGDTAHLLPLAAVAEEAAEHRPGAAAELLLALGAHAPAALGALYRTAGSRSLRRLVVAVVGELRLAEHAGLLVQALRDDDEEVRARAARGVGAIGDAEAVPELHALLSDALRPVFVRAQAATALGRIGDASSVPVLERALRDGPWLLRERAAAALRELGPLGRAALVAVASGGDVQARAALA
jgi:HEAT repeat protein